MSREIDAEVATKVFGYPAFTWSSEEMDYAMDTGKPGESVIIVPLPAYSTDIAAAWRVVEHLSRLDDPIFMVNIQTSFDASPDLSEYEVWIDGPNGRWIEYGSAPEAICKAALAAVETVASSAQGETNAT